MVKKIIFRISQKRASVQMHVSTVFQKVHGSIFNKQNLSSLTQFRFMSTDLHFSIWSSDAYVDFWFKWKYTM